MILAIFGRCAVGKTTIAEIMGARLLIPVRHCGIALRAAAAEAGSTVEDAAGTIHARVDGETIEWCERQAAGGGIVEGRFLDHVLSSQAGIFFIGMTATLEERAKRLQGRLGREVGVGEIADIDRADDLFRSDAYGLLRRAKASLTIDTTEGAAGAWAEELECRIREGPDTARD